MAEWLLDDHPAPPAALFIGQPCGAKLVNDWAEEAGSGSEVIDDIATRFVLRVLPFERFTKLLVGRRIFEVSLKIVEMLF